MTQNPGFRRQARIKLATALFNMQALDAEMSTYDVYALQKSAAVGAGRDQRIKYAALIRQRELEKQAFMRALAPLLRSGLAAGKQLIGAGARRLGGTAAGKAVGSAAGKGLGAATSAAKIGVPAAAAGGIGYGVGNSRGFASGDAAGYGRGSAEGGAEATRHLFQGLMDLQQQGAKSKSNLSTLAPKSKPKPAVAPSAPVKKAQDDRVKVAMALCNMQALQQEMKRYDTAQLQKEAAAGSNIQARIKYAALACQHELEKQALIGGLARMAGKGLMGAGKMLGRGLGKGAVSAAKGIGSMGAGAVKGGMKGMQNTYSHAAANGGGIGTAASQVLRSGPIAGRMNRKGVSMLNRAAGGATHLQGPSARRLATTFAGMTPGRVRGMAIGQAGQTIGDTVKGGLRGAGQGIAQAAKANPGNALMGAGAAGIGAGTQLPSMLPSVQQAGQNVQQNVQAAQSGAGNFFNNVGQAGQDIFEGFQQAGSRF